MIAEPDLAFVWELEQTCADGRPRTIRLEVGHPVYAEQPFPGWRCLVRLEGMLPEGAPIIGATAMQAFSLALRFGREMLRAAAAEGRLVERASGGELTLEMIAEGHH